MRNLYLTIFCGFILFLVSCQKGGEENQLEGFTSLKKGIHYKFIEANDDGITPVVGDLAFLHATLRQNDSIISTTYTTNEMMERMIGELESDFPIEGVVKLMSVNDSVTVALEVDSLEAIQKPFERGFGQLMYLDIRLMKIEFISERKNLQKTILSSFKKQGNGFHYTFHKDVEGVTPKAGEHVTCSIIMRNNDRIKLRTGDRDLPRNVIMPKDDQFSSPLHRAIYLMSVGDSMTVGIETDSLPGKTKGYYTGDIMEVDIKLLAIRDAATAEEAVQAATRKANELKEDAKRKAVSIPNRIQNIIQEYKEGKLPVIKDKTNLEYLILEEGSGEKVANGKKVGVHYSGHFLKDGKKFDSSFDRGSPYYFKLGRKEVIEGWDVGVSHLKKGTTAVLFVPYYMAYGDKGFGKVIPARANLVFYVEVME